MKYVGMFPTCFKTRFVCYCQRNRDEDRDGGARIEKNEKRERGGRLGEKNEQVKRKKEWRWSC